MLYSFLQNQDEKESASANESDTPRSSMVKENARKGGKRQRKHTDESISKRQRFEEDVPDLHQVCAVVNIKKII